MRFVTNIAYASGSPRGVDTQPTISVVIPTLNEAANLPHVFARLPDCVDEVVLVDGHSTDDTIAVAQLVRPDVRVVLQDGRGKGNALACGFAAASGRHHRDARRRRFDRPGRDPALRRARCSRAPTSPRARASSRAAAAPTSRRCGSSATSCLNGTVNVLLRHALHRSLLRLQRLLAPLPAAHQRRLRRVRGRDADQHARSPGPASTWPRSRAIEHERLSRREQAPPVPRRPARAAHDRAGAVQRPPP